MRKKILIICGILLVLVLLTIGLNYAKEEEEEVAVVDAPSTNRFVWLLVLNTWMCTLFYGMAPALLPYACLPYGSLTYSLTIRLTALVIPIASLVSFWLKTSSSKVIAVLTAIGTLLMVYVFYLALQSPTPPLMHSSAGPAILVRLNSD
jgi:riboflavin transporter 2